MRVNAISVNPVDTKIRRSSSKGIEHHEASPRIFGWDAAGVVETTGEDVRMFQPGDEVYYFDSIIRSGCISEYHLVDKRIVAKKPVSLSMTQSAALPLRSITTYEALFERMGIAKNGQLEGQVILIIGGAGGVGSMAIQLAKQSNFVVVAPASRTESESWCRQMGADAAMDHSQSMLPQLQQLGYPTADYILNTSHTEQH